MEALTLLLILALIDHDEGVAHAFQPRPRVSGIPGHHLRRISSYKQNAYATPSYNFRGDGRLSAAESDTAFDEILEKFAMPLEFKKRSDDFGKDPSSGNSNLAATSDAGSSKSEGETPPPTANKVTSTDATTDASTDTPLANKYYLKMMQKNEEARLTESSPVKEKIAETTVETPTPVPPAPAPRRRFTDFGIASEQLQPINGEPSLQSSEESPAATPKQLRGFTDWSISGQSRPVKVLRPDGAGNIENNVPATESLSGIAKPSADTTTTNTDIKPTDAKTATDSKIPNAATANDSTKAPSTSGSKVEQAPSATAIVQEEKGPPAAAPGGTAKPASSTTKEERASVETAASKEKQYPSAKLTVEEGRDTLGPDATTSQPAAGLIQTQSASPSSTLTIPSVKLDVEDFGLLPLIIIGVSVYLALAVYLKQVNDTDDGYAGWDELRKGQDNDGSKEPGLIGKIAEESKSLIQKVKDAGTAGAISYALWEAAFWGVSIPVCLVSYRQVTGHWPDLTNSEDVKKVGLEAFAFVNVARFAVPIRIGLALSTVPWVEENIMGRFKGGQAKESEEVELMDDQVMMPTTFENSQSWGGDYSGDAGSQRTGEELAEGFDTSSQQPQLPFDYVTGEEIEDEDTLAISEMEQRLNIMESEASLISSRALKTINAGIDPTLLEYCEPGQVDEDCVESIQGYLDSLASTGALATDGEVKAIVGYLDSLSSNVTPNEQTGAAFTSYLDALSSGNIPAPSSAEAVASYLDVLSNGDDIPEGTSPKEIKMGSRINDVEERLGRLEASVSSLPDDIASRLVDWQISQDKKLSDEMEKIMELLVEGKSLEK